MFRALMLAAAAVSLVVFFAACGGDGGSDEPQQITFMAGFRAQANLPFVAVYVADAKGFFADEGLSVDIQHSSGQDEHLKLLLEDRVQFVTATASQVIRRRVDGLPVQAVALFGQRGDQGFIARADSGIASPADFAGHTVGFKAGVVPAELHALLATAGLTVDDIELQSVGFDPRTFIEGEVEIYPVFLNNEPDTVQRAGVEINIFDPHDLGVPTLGLTYLATEKTVSGDTELVERFLRATLRAIEYIESNIDEAVEITLTYADGADSDHQLFLLETDFAAAQRADGIGRGDAAQWQALVELLLEYDVIEQGTDVDRAFVGSFVDDLYDDDDNLH
jgi:ABC-type nitrate/sulfonate/bicarbonate transport system substrate-binding protein